MLEALTAYVARALWEALTGVPARRKPPGTFDERVDAAAEALREASQTVTELEVEIAARRDAVARLEQQRKVLDVDRDKLVAVANLLNEDMRADSRRALWIGIGSNALFFILGVVVTLLVQ
jgi:hypothetical protein